MYKLTTTLLASLLLTGGLYAQQATKDGVSQLYRATFDRVPDQAGLDYWVNDSGLTLEEVATSFFDQPETKLLYPANTSTEDFIGSVYGNVFKRKPDAGGAAYWKAGLDNGSTDKSTFILATINGAQGNDALLLADNSSLGINYTQNDYSQNTCTQEYIPQGVVDTTNSTVISTLTQELKDSITYMYNEEKLAKDIYLNIYNMQPIIQLYNIADKSETTHQQAVNDLAIKYDLNVTIYPDTVPPYDQKDVDAYGSGQYPIVSIQELYDLLYDKGIQSPQDALEVGCLVEVTDIDDLDKYMIYAQESNAPDVLAVFDFLRVGSYRHYWAFDQGLKSMGISTGCCSLGEEYCHPEYSQN